MSEREFVRITDSEMEDPMTIQMLSEATGARITIIAQLIRSGLIETIGNPSNDPLVPQGTVLRVRKMLRLRRDLGVNFSGASIIVDLIDRMNVVTRELAQLRRRVGE